MKSSKTITFATLVLGLSIGVLSMKGIAMYERNQQDKVNRAYESGYDQGALDFIDNHDLNMDYYYTDGQLVSNEDINHMSVGDMHKNLFTGEYSDGRTMSRKDRYTADSIENKRFR
jgi:hypothetical protein